MSNLGDLAADKKSLHAVDWVIIAVYFVLCLGVGFYIKFRKTRRGMEETSEGYFLAGRSMMWWAVGPSLFASNIGSEHFVGLAGSGAATGIGVVAFEWQACWVLLLLGWVFVPIYLKSQVFTMPEFLKKRFESQWVRTYITIVALISYVFTKFSVDIYAGSLFLYEAVGWNMYWSALCILLITAVYTLLGGLMAVIFTDVLQCAVMVLGAFVLAVMSFNEVGGYDVLWEKYPLAIGKPHNAYNASAGSMTYNGTVADGGCYKITPYWGNMFRPLDDPDYPWLASWTTVPIMCVWYFCTDQVLVQRALGAKNNVHAKAGSIVAGFLKILPMFIMVMPGMISRVLFKDTIGCADPESCLAACNNKWGCYNNAYPKLVLNVLPVGLVGVIMAVMMAALMSSLSSAFNSSATIFTVDVWLRVRPKANEREKLIVGRVVVALLVGISMCWLPVIQGSAGQQLFVYLQTIQSYLAPPITMTFTLAIFWPGLTAAGALSGLLVGLLLGMMKFIMGNVFPTPECGMEDTRPSYVKMHFLYYALIEFGVSGTVMVVVSFFTEKVPRNRLGGLTWSTINDPPVAHGGIGEEHLQTCETVVNNDALQLLETGKGIDKSSTAPETKLEAGKDESKAIESASANVVFLSVVQFPEEEPVLKWFLRIMSALLLVFLLVLWIIYR